MKARRFKVPLALIALLVATPALAQSEDDARLRMQLRTVTLQLRQAQDDIASAQAQKIAAQTERDQLKKQLAAAQAELARARRSDNRAANAAVESELAKVKDTLAQAADAAEKDKAEREKMQADALSTANVLGVCQAKNAKLLAVARQILREYENFDALDAIGANEPFTKLKRVELENLAQDYGDRIDDGIFDPRSVPAPQPAAATPPKN
ncbi:MAG TPA: hypothetical protein VG889_19175 [Rhizomicrobium sp.]|nr:hypothetical protein [Rhizomicrobium sp.]